VLKDSFLAETIIGRRACNGAIELITKSRNFYSSLDIILVNPLRVEICKYKRMHKLYKYPGKKGSLRITNRLSISTYSHQVLYIDLSHFIN